MLLYDTDYSDWANTQARLLRCANFTCLDIENIAEELESLAKREKRMLTKHLELWMLHELKTKYQPEMHTRSWELSIKVHKRDAVDLLNDNPCLKPQLKEIMEDAYYHARMSAAIETGLDLEVFPEECLWKTHELFENIHGKYIKLSE